ncbi:MAG: hypothetical protein AAGP08_16725 [Pseudomonadota bacterium]
MNANQIINMVIRQIMRRLINGGINKGMDVAGKTMSKSKAPPPVEDDRNDPRRS